MPDGSKRPVAFASRSFTKTEGKYAQIDKEALSIVWGVKRFHVYLYGKWFTLITDHKPLTAIFHPKKGVPAMTATRLQRYALFLAGFDYNIEYKSTTKHCTADGLFRLPLQRTKREETEMSLHWPQRRIKKGVPAMTAARLQRYALFLAGFNYDIEYKSTTKHCIADGLSRLPLQQTKREETEKDLSEVFHATQFELLPVTSEAVARETSRDPILARVYESIVKGWSVRIDGDERNELTVHQGCILWGIRVVIPN